MHLPPFRGKAAREMASDETRDARDQRTISHRAHCRRSRSRFRR
jgi:hypothetical protein